MITNPSPPNTQEAFPPSTARRAATPDEAGATLPDELAGVVAATDVVWATVVAGAEVAEAPFGKVVLLLPPVSASVEPMHVTPGASLWCFFWCRLAGTSRRACGGTSTESAFQAGWPVWMGIGAWAVTEEGGLMWPVGRLEMAGDWVRKASEPVSGRSEKLLENAWGGRAVGEADGPVIVPKQQYVA